MFNFPVNWQAFFHQEIEKPYFAKLEATYEESLKNGEIH